ncbi:MAG: hypothetical protein M1830_005419 [Pleopsidium flavum]|nr:MAG: hypothetical protein M1830_005419 [Pleopsidium flavum]
MAAGDVGGTRSGGEAAGLVAASTFGRIFILILVPVNSDAFNKREKADENYYIKKMEKEKLMALKEKLQQQRKHLTELEKHMYAINSSL